MENVTRIETAWRDLHSALAGIPDERMGEPGAAGDWSAKDLLAHVAFWHDQMVETVRRHAAGEDVPSPDVEALNQREAARRAAWTLAQTRDEAQHSYERALAVAREFPDIDSELLAVDTWEHYAEHAADIRAWRARVGL